MPFGLVRSHPSNIVHTEHTRTKKVGREGVWERLGVGREGRATKQEMLGVSLWMPTQTTFLRHDPFLPLPERSAQPSIPNELETFNLGFRDMLEGSLLPAPVHTSGDTLEVSGVLA
jgi:hypothetical protein